MEPAVLTPEQILEQKIRDAENAKARMFPIKGKNPNNCDFVSTSLMDENYLMVGAHLDQQMIEKIQRGDYIDFGKLLPKDRILMEEDQRLEMVIRRNKTYYVPVSESGTINSFHKWEKAFRVFSNIYTKKFPEKSA